MKTADATHHDTTQNAPTKQDSIKPYLYAFGALMVLLIATVEVARHDLGWLNFPMTMAIATSKAAIILWIFMNLRGSTSLTRLVAALGFLWLGIMFVLTTADYLTRSPEWIGK